MPKIQLRNDTSTNWTTANPTLLAGEVGVETNTNKFKIGDGTTAWNSLAYQGGDFSNYYTKSQTDALLEGYVPSDSVTSPLSYSIISHSQTSVNNNTTYFWSVNPTWGNGIPTTNAYRGFSMYCMTTGDGNGIIEPSFPVIYNGTIADREFRWTADNTDEPQYYPIKDIIIGNVDGTGKFTPYYFTACDGGYSGDERKFFAIDPSSVTYSSYGYGGHLPAHYATQFDISTATSLFTYCPYRNTNLWSGKLIITNNNGSPSFTFYGYDKLGNQVHTTTSSSNPYNVDIADLNCILFPIRLYQASSTDYNYDIDKWGAYDSQGNKLWSVADTTYTKYLQLNIGSGLAISNNNLINTNPTVYSLPTASQSTLGGVKVDGTSITIDGNGVISSSGGGGGGTVDQTYNSSSTNAQSGTAVAEALSSFTITNINGGNA